MAKTENTFKQESIVAAVQGLSANSFLSQQLALPCLGEQFDPCEVIANQIMKINNEEEDLSQVMDALLVSPDTGERLLVASPPTEEEDGYSSCLLADKNGAITYKLQFRLEEV